MLSWGTVEQLKPRSYLKVTARLASLYCPVNIVTPGLVNWASSITSVMPVLPLFVPQSLMFVSTSADDMQASLMTIMSPCIRADFLCIASDCAVFALRGFGSFIP